MVPLPRHVVRELDLLTERGVEIVAIERGGRASSSELEPGDIIVAINDRVATSVDDLHRLLIDFQGQPKVELTIVRDNRRLDVECRLQQ